jgi:hypothetical protein
MLVIELITIGRVGNHKRLIRKKKSAKSWWEGTWVEEVRPREGVVKPEQRHRERERVWTEFYLVKCLGWVSS